MLIFIHIADILKIFTVERRYFADRQFYEQIICRYFGILLTKLLIFPKSADIYQQYGFSYVFGVLGVSPNKMQNQTYIGFAYLATILKTYRVSLDEGRILGRFDDG